MKLTINLEANTGKNEKEEKHELDILSIYPIIEKVISELKLDRCYYFKVNNQYNRVRASDITILESAKNYSYVMTTDHKYVVRKSLKELVKLLPAMHFCRVHKSYIINLLHVDAVENTIVSVNKQSVPIGKCYRKDFLKRIELLC